MDRETRSTAPNDTGRPGAAPAARRRRFWLKLAAWSVFWLWFAQFAYVRYTTPPAIALRGEYSAPAPSPNPEDERLETAIEEIGTHPAWSGDAWTAGREIELTCGLPLGMVRSRYDKLVKAVTDPKLRPRLDELVEAATRHREAARPGQVRDRRSATYWWNSSETLAAGALILRSRLNRDAEGSIGDSVAHLSAALQVGQYAELRWAAEPAYFWTRPATLPALFEIGRLALDEPLAPADARTLIDLISRDRGLLVSAALAGSGLSGDVDAMLDRFYTDDGRGDGWLVLSAAADVPWLEPLHSRLSPSPLWNVFSPLFHSRREIRQQVADLIRTLEDLDNLDFSAGLQRTDEAMVVRRTVLDGPLLRTGLRLTTDAYRSMADLVRRRRATVIFLALSACRHDRGEYPESLDALAPTYINEVPRDPYTGGPFRYAIESGGVNLDSSTPIEVSPGDYSYYYTANWWPDLVPVRKAEFLGGGR